VFFAAVAFLKEAAAVFFLRARPPKRLPKRTKCNECRKKFTEKTRLILDRLGIIETM
jgi:hypothetical protein